MAGIPTIVTSRTTALYERPPQGPFVFNKDGPLSQYVKAWWPLGKDENRGTYLDYANRDNANRYDMLMTGALAPASGPFGGGFAPSNTGTNANYLQCDVAPPVTAAPLMVAAWLWPVANSAAYNMWDQTTLVAGNYWSLLAKNGANGTISWACAAASSETSAVSAATLKVQDWNCCVGVDYAAASRAVFLNNVKTTNSTSKAPSAPLRMGIALFRDNSGQFSPLNGRVSDVCVWGGFVPTDNFVALIYDPATRWSLYYPTGTKTWTFYDTPVATGITFDAASNSGYQAAASTYSWSHTCTGSNRFLGVDISLLSAGQTVTSITYNGVALSPISGASGSTVTSFGRVECWGLANPASGANTIAVTLSGSIASAGTAVSYANVNQSLPTEAGNFNQATNTGSATDATVAITSVADQDWIHAAIATDDAAVTAGQTSRNNVTGLGGSGADEDFGPQSPGAKTMSYTNLGIVSTWAIAGYAIRPVSASGLTTPWGWDSTFPDRTADALVMLPY